MINNSAPNHNLLTPENERKRTPPFPERLDSVYWPTQDPCLFLAVSPEEPARSVAIFAPRAQSRDRTEGGRGTRGREKGTRVVGRSPAPTEVWRRQVITVENPELSVPPTQQKNTDVS